MIIHEYAHERMCNRRDVRVFEVCYFRIGNPAGYVKHERTNNFADTFAISGAPFLINTFLAIMLFIPLALLAVVATEVQAINENNLVLNLIALFIAWIGFSTGMHAIPSSTDAKNIWHHSKREWRRSLFATLGMPVAALIYVGDKLRFFWFDAIYTILLLAITVVVVEFALFSTIL